MSALFSHEDLTVPPRGTSGLQALHVRSVRYANTAAKFWGGLREELSRDFPSCSLLELWALTSGRLIHDDLHPLQSLAADIDLLMEADFAEVMSNTLEQLKLTGPPTAVHYRMQDGEAEVAAGELPLDCVDAEIFPYLLAWLLEWGGIPCPSWNDPSLEGAFTAEDRLRSLSIEFRFLATCRHLSEGLYERRVRLSI